MAYTIQQYRTGGWYGSRGVGLVMPYLDPIRIQNSAMGFVCWRAQITGQVTLWGSRGCLYGCIEASWRSGAFIAG